MSAPPLKTEPDTEGRSGDNTGVIIDHLDLWTGAVTAKSTNGRGGNGRFELTGIKKLRELILELAVRGKLVPQDPSEEPASVLLEKIAAEKARLVKEGKIKKPKALPEVSEEEKPFAVPEGWEWARISCLCNLENGDRSKNYPNKSALVDSGIPFVNAGHLNNGQISLGEITFITEERFEQLRSGKFRNGDILFCLRGSLGKCALVQGFDKGAIASSLIIARPFSKNFGKYILLFLNAPLAETFIRRFDNGTAQPNLSGADFGRFPIPTPPLAEQHRIVQKVDELMALCDRLEQQTNDQLAAHETLVDTLLDTLTRSADAAELADNWARLQDHFDTLFTTEHSIDRLKQTILQLAVMGRLVPQDPGDEPASVLLEKIAAEKTRLVKEGKIKKPKALPEVSEEEKPFSVPEGWEWVRVWDVANLITSGSRDWAKYYSKSGAIFVTMGNLARGDYKLRMDKIRYVSPPENGEGSRTKLQPNDLVVSITGDVGNLGLIPEGFGEAYINQHSCLIRVNNNCRNHYFPEYMRSPLARWQFDAPQRGIKNSFRLSDVGEMLLPLPPEPEQHRIVQKVDELMAICDQLKARLNHACKTQQQLAEAVVEQAIA